MSHRNSWAWAVILLFSAFLNPPLMTSPTRICHFCLSLCCMIYNFYIKATTTTSAKFLIKPFYMVCSWMTSFMVCGKLTYSQALIFFIRIRQTESKLENVPTEHWQPLYNMYQLLYHRQVKWSFFTYSFTQNASLLGVMWTEAILDIVAKLIWIF